MKVIGLTGGIASGKSAITTFLAERDAYVIDADKLGHKVYDVGTEAFQQVVDTFGPDVVGENGEIDRKILGSKVFGDADALKKLTDIAWPAIKRMAKDEIEHVRSTRRHTCLVLEAAVLIEASWMDIVDEVWVVSVDREVAISRTMSRDNLDRAAVVKRIDSQLTNDERAKHATVIFDNSGSWDDLWSQVNSAFKTRIASS